MVILGSRVCLGRCNVCRADQIHLVNIPAAHVWYHTENSTVMSMQLFIAVTVLAQPAEAMVPNGAEQGSIISRLIRYVSNA